ncbi:MAG: LysR family transcriptional regulator [Syntrophobacteraceae bacterium]
MSLAGNKALLLECKRPDDMNAEKHEPTMRLHVWLEIGEGVFLGTGRALLLAGIEEHGSLRKAAEDLGMSYRAAWGKIRRTEELMGVKLIARNGCRRGGHLLTAEGRRLKEMYFQWFREVEQVALEKARDIFPWVVKSYAKKARGKIFQCLVAASLAYCPFEALIETGI